MPIKYFLLAFLAIQTVNSGVIKLSSVEEDFELLLIHVRTHAWICTVLFSRIEEGYPVRSYYIRDHAQKISVAAEIALQQTEEFFKANAEWGVVCFKDTQEQLALAYDELKTNNEKCIAASQVTADELLEETLSYENAANAMHDDLNSTWTNCNGDALCQTDLYQQASMDLEAFTAEFLVYKAGVDRFVSDINGGVSGELMDCVHDYYQKVYFDALHDIVKPIPKCLQQNRP